MFFVFVGGRLLEGNMFLDSGSVFLLFIGWGDRDLNWIVVVGYNCRAFFEGVR